MSDQVKQRLDAGIEPQRKVYNKWQTKLKRRNFQQKAIRRGLFAVNILILVVIAIFVFAGPSKTTGSASVANLNTSAINSLAPSPLDQVASASIALTVAQMSNLPEATPINNQADTQQAELAMASTADNIVSEPQVTQTALKSRADISHYSVVSGDSVASIANKFGVTSDSIIWSNGLKSGSVLPGQTIVIPPVNGIVYTVKSGDTVASLATAFQASESQIVAYNDAEISGITPGELIIIPSATEPNAQGSAIVAVNWTPAYGSNGYDYGFCTWYVASQIAVPNNWGNAASWSFYASQSGWNVSSTPTVGAIAQTPFAAGGEGHVAIVDAVSPDGSQIKYADMNGLAGWGRVGYSGWVSASLFPNYIAH